MKKLLPLIPAGAGGLATHARMQMDFEGAARRSGLQLPQNVKAN